MIPVAVLTGFLGSGKTTLLSRLLKSREFARTAVIINEFGEVGLDHELVETSDESFVELQTGCLCCKVRGDLVRTLEDLLRRRDAGTVTPFERVVIETSGLADPAPILHAVMADAGLAQRLFLSGVITTVDAINGLDTLARQPESVKQVAVADRLVLTMTDLEAAPHGLLERLATLNPTAPLVISSFGTVDAEQLFDMRLDASTGQEVGLGSRLDLTELARDRPVPHDHASHDSHISYFAILREKPIRAITLTLLLEILAEHCGADVLRLKAIIDVAEFPDRPAVIHGVQHIFHPPAWLERWPSADRRSRFIFIVRGIPKAWVEALLEALAAEVDEVAGNVVVS